MQKIVDGHIYIIRCRTKPKIFYIGSTYSSLSKRWEQHKAQYRRGTNDMSIYPHFEEHGLDNFCLELIKTYKVVKTHHTDSKHLRMYEQLHINKLKKCCNKKSPFKLIKILKSNEDKNKLKQKRDEDELQKLKKDVNVLKAINLVCDKLNVNRDNLDGSIITDTTFNEILDDKLGLKIFWKECCNLYKKCGKLDTHFKSDMKVRDFLQVWQINNPTTFIYDTEYKEFAKLLDKNKIRKLKDFNKNHFDDNKNKNRTGNMSIDNLKSGNFLTTAIRLSDTDLWTETQLKNRLNFILNVIDYEINGVTSKSKKKTKKYTINKKR